MPSSRIHAPSVVKAGTHTQVDQLSSSILTKDGVTWVSHFFVFSHSSSLAQTMGRGLVTPLLCKGQDFGSGLEQENG